MKISIEKPRENNWKFPCLGTTHSGTKVYFSDWEMGVVVESGDDYKIGHTSTTWNMGKFTPIDINGFELNKPKLIDWDNVTLPIWAKNIDGLVFLIYAIKEKRVSYFIIYENYIRFTNEKVFCSISDRNEWFNSLEIISGGTEIKIVV